MNIYQLFFELIQVSLDNRETLTRKPSADEWMALSSLCEKHALTGIGYVGIEKILSTKPTDCDNTGYAAWNMPRQLTRQWFSNAEQIKNRNEYLSLSCTKITEYFYQNGFDSLILKGQGNLNYYPNSLNLFRTPGDVDVWLYRTNSNVCNKEKVIIEYLLGLCNNQKHKVSYLHADWKWNNDIDVEVHIRPTFLNNPFKNRKLQKWLNSTIECRTDSLGFKYPSPAFNAVFQLTHIYKHLFDEGIGLRQLMDYYFVIVHLDNSNERISEQELLRLINKLGMMNFLSAIMYVLQKVFLLPDSYLLCKPDEKNGKPLLIEILKSGNFGQSDFRLIHYAPGNKTKLQIQRAIQRVQRNSMFLLNYPSEVLWEPWCRIYHLLWRKYSLWRFV